MDHDGQIPEHAPEDDTREAHRVTAALRVAVLPAVFGATAAAIIAWGLRMRICIAMRRPTLRGRMRCCLGG